MRDDGTLYWLLSDHLGGTTITADSSGDLVAEIRYRPYGKSRYTDGTTPTTFHFTGQREESAIGLYYYGARWYDAQLGRFVQPDPIVPDPGDPQSLNRYTYAKNNPVRFTDPSGYFSEEQLEGWFASDWSSMFDVSWRTILLRAEFGDLLTHGNSQVVFAEQDGSVAFWDVNERSPRSVVATANAWKGDRVAGFRSIRANFGDGPSPGNLLNLGENSNPEHAAYNRSNEYAYIYGYAGAATSQVLPLDWYAGSDYHVAARTYCAGLDAGTVFLEIANIGFNMAVNKLVTGAFFSIAAPPLAVGSAAFFVVDVATWTTWDTAYYIYSGSGTPPAQPAPTPR
jgi:RHS repeat-associated protein